MLFLSQDRLQSLHFCQEFRPQREGGRALGQPGCFSRVLGPAVSGPRHQAVTHHGDADRHRRSSWCMFDLGFSTGHCLGLEADRESLGWGEFFTVLKP